MTRPVSCSGEVRCYGAGPGSVEFEISGAFDQGVDPGGDVVHRLVQRRYRGDRHSDVGQAELSGQQRGKS